MKDLLLFHWSPTERRGQINHLGLLPSSRPTTNVALEDGRPWRAPYVCFCPSPSWAWALSGRFRPDVASWDLWQVWRSWLPRNRAIWEAGKIKEVRAFERVYKRHLWYVATRTVA